ncbi:DNA-processing protein DprA [Aquisediminimonas profunda]|uniref:DNA-processing protein DprA n=1 Tax=Aquisediminimonas profunda TaxID=1550733 RepID=UPI001C638CB7|nr:DNA-processing protein DprA [Aquisediminimonas profunda]
MTGTGQDLLDRLRLIRSANIGPVTYFQLIRRFGSPGAALAALPELASRGGGKAPRLADMSTIVGEVETVERLGARYLFLGQGLYPPLLAEIDSAPPALIVRGDLAILEQPAVAIVGARNASAAAMRFASRLAQDLADAGVAVVSGLARGIDTSAHRGALATGATVGVIASGIDIAYPPENAELQEKIAAQGILIAEQPPGREPLARHFPSRNRIIAGMSQGTVVVEAAPKSGSLITARLANECGREVMAVPGSPLDPRAQGCNLLIREGATLIQSASDVLEMIRPIYGNRMKSAQPPFQAEPENSEPTDEERQAVWDLLSLTPVSVDEIIRQAAMHPAAVQLILLELEIAGRLERHAGGRVSCA